MSDQPEHPHLRMEERVEAGDVLYKDMFHQGDNKVLLACLAGAVVLHAVFLFIKFPEIKAELIQKDAPKVLVVKQYVPPPPKVKERQVVVEEIKIKVPLPDPTPDEPEPIREPEPEIVPVPVDLDFEFDLGDPEPPPPGGPLVAGVQGVTNPILIEESKIRPEYPEIARRARLTANLVMQAIVYKDGTVGEVEVLRCSRPNVGFEEKAVEAVLQWRYEPAKQNNKPVDVYFTIQVSFTLN